MDKKLNQAIKEYTLTETELEVVKKVIIQFIKVNHKPSNNPIAIVVGGQSGSGKSSLMAYAGRELPDAIFIDNDTLRAFHPYADEIREKYPEYYVQLTDQLGMEITSSILEYFMGDNAENNKYDIILHQTLKNNRVADDAIAKFHKAGYLVDVKVLAVSYFESKMSQIERCLAQYNSMGFCRHVSQSAHWDAIKGVPFTVSYIEETGKSDIMQVYVRTIDISNPKVIYSKSNENSKDRIQKVFKERKLKVLEDYDYYGYQNAKQAINKARETDSFKCMTSLRGRLNAVIKNGGHNVPGMSQHIEELEKEMEKFIDINNLEDSPIFNK